MGQGDLRQVKANLGLLNARIQTSGVQAQQLLACGHCVPFVHQQGRYLSAYTQNHLARLGHLQRAEKGQGFGGSGLSGLHFGRRTGQFGQPVLIECKSSYDKRSERKHDNNSTDCA